MNIYIREKRNNEELFCCRYSGINILIQKIITKFCILQEREIPEGLEIIVPNIEYKKLVFKMVKRKEKLGNARIVLSNKIKKLSINWKEADIVNGRRMQKYFLPKILERINIIVQDIYIVLDSYTMENIQIIEYFIEKCRSINIVTKEIKKYSEWAEKIYEEKGIIVTVSNNKRKGLKRAGIIINIDFSAKRIKEFKIERNAIIINCVEDKIEDISGFEGIIINKVELEIEKDSIFKEYEAIEVYESLYQFKEKYSLNVQKTEKQKIIKFIGNNGRIEDTEIANIAKIT